MSESYDEAAEERREHRLSRVMDRISDERGIIYLSLRDLREIGDLAEQEIAAGRDWGPCPVCRSLSHEPGCPQAHL